METCKRRGTVDPPRFRALAVGFCLIMAVPDAPPLRAAIGSEGPEDEKVWSDKAELTYLATSGNANAETLGFRNTLIRHWLKGQATLEAGAVRAEDTRRTRSAELLPSGRIQIEEINSTELTAESLFLRGRYDRDFSDRLFWFVGSGWERNEFAGIESRVSSVAGVGYKWYERDGDIFSTDLGVTYT